MKLDVFLKDFIFRFIDIYRDYFKKTFEAAMIFSLIGTIIASLFLLQAPDSIFEHIKEYSFLSLFRSPAYVYHQGYILIDLYKPLILILSALFAIGFKRTIPSGKFKFIDILSEITSNDLWNVLLATVAIVLTDIACQYLQHSYNYKSIEVFYSLFGVFRTYLPYIYLGTAFSYSEYNTSIQFRPRSILYMLLSVLIFIIILNNVHYLIEIPFHLISMVPFTDMRLLIEIIVSIPIISLYVLGFVHVISFTPEYFHNQWTKLARDDEENEESEIFTKID
jgi:hypothetical protein